MELPSLHILFFLLFYMWLTSPFFTVIKQVTCTGHGSFSLCHSLPFRQHCFITATRAHAKGDCREQCFHLVSPLLGSWGAGEGQSEAEGKSKPLCLLDLCHFMLLLSEIALSLFLSFFNRATALALMVSLFVPSSLFFVFFLTLECPPSLPTLCVVLHFSFCGCFFDSTIPWLESLSFSTSTKISRINSRS